jgi:hypothetical protein|tara:strand:+ start:520 stop:696 length:177 start_codon:yes stop_codon:yes gene_type:complete
MKEALIVINLVVSASFFVTLTYLVYLRIQREKRELEMLTAAEAEEPQAIHDLFYAEGQ